MPCLSPFAEVRAEAIAHLRDRPLHDFVPMLLDALAAPVQSAYRVSTDPDGSVHYMHALYREGPFADWSYRSMRSIYQPGSPMGMAANFLTPESSSAYLANVNNVASVTSTPPRVVSSAGAARSARQYEEEITAREREVAEANQAAAALNERIIAVLTGTTGQQLGSEPRAWWNWWQDYTDYYRTDDRPVYATRGKQQRLHSSARCLVGGCRMFRARHAGLDEDRPAADRVARTSAISCSLKTSTRANSLTSR